MGIKTLVLGGGFIGSHIADRAIELGHETFVLVRSLPPNNQFNIKAKYVIYNKSIFDSVNSELELKEINYKGSVVLCGYGEPMLHKDIYKISKKLEIPPIIT